MKKLIVVLAVVVLVSGCTSNRFVHETFNSEGDPTSHTEINYNALGGKEIQDIYGMKTPKGHWEFGVGATTQQDIDVETLTSSIVEALKGELK
jgi:PBP1b-binding outer membrane lipoprotein LpoB